MTKWTKALERFSTSHWPRHLFHTAQIEVAVEIIKANKIICRKDQSRLICDVANQGALGNNVEAHKYARLYFRPKNGYHLKTEGIKAIEDHNRGDPHMSVPIAFLFDAIRTLSEQDSYFTRGNFAKTGVEALTGDANFDTLDFSQIYHDSDPGSRGEEVRNMRMSEVVIPAEISLKHLKSVVCRTLHEARMLSYLLDCEGLKYPIINVEQRGSVFFKKAIFIVDIYTEGNALYLRFHAPVYYSKNKYDVEIQVDFGGSNQMNKKCELPASTLCCFDNIPFFPNAVWTVLIEGCTAFKGRLPSKTGLIV